MNTQLSAIEKDMSTLDFNEVSAFAEKAKANIKAATTVADLKSQICQVWAKVGKYVKWAEHVPFVGKFFTVLADVLDTLCG